MARAHAAIPAGFTTTRHPPSQNGPARALENAPDVEVINNSILRTHNNMLNAGSMTQHLRYPIIGKETNLQI